MIKRLFAVAVAISAVSASACTAVIVGKKASSTGCVMVGHNEDGGGAVIRHASVPATDGNLAFYWSEVKHLKGKYIPGDLLLNEKGVLVLSNNGGFMSEWCGRKGKLPNEGEASKLVDGGIGFELRRDVALKARTAREGVDIATNLVARFGYNCASRIFTIADKDEAWVVEVIRGKRYVARRVPDDAVVVHPNCLSIRKIRPDDVVSANIAAKGPDFDFTDAYQGPRTWKSPYNLQRWRGLYRATTGVDLPETEFPFSVKPLRPVTVEMIKTGLCSHYEGTTQAVKPHPAKADETAERTVAPICRSSTQESIVCLFAEDVANLVLHSATGRPCETPYAAYRPLAGVLPADASRGEMALKRFRDHANPLLPEKTCVSGRKPKSDGACENARSGTVPAWEQLTDQATVDRCIRAHEGTTPARFLKPGVVELPANLSTVKGDRVYWDIKIPLDMKLVAGLSFDFFCSDMEPISGFSIYFKSGKGWYTGGFVPREQGRFHRIEVPKSAVRRTEGEVAGWSRVSAVRLAFWRGRRKDARIEIANLALYGDKPNVLVLGGDSCSKKNPNEDYAGYAASMTELLSSVGLSPVQVSDAELDAAALTGIRLVVLPYNPSLPEGALEQLKAFRANGGRLLACYSLAKGVGELMGLKSKGWHSVRQEPALAGVVGVARVGEGLSGQPALFPQRSHNMAEVAPVGEGRVLGVWADKDGRQVGPAAFVETPAGFHLGHVWMGTGPDARALMRAIATAVDPQIAEVCAEAERKMREQEAKDAAFVAAQPAKPGEWRAFWCHSELGLGGAHSWDDSIRILKDNGFNAILPNLAWANKIYPTDECLAACRKYGVECHVWKVCWRANGRMKDFTPPGGCQKSYDGKENKSWMCPSDPANLASEIETFVQLAKLGPTGVHFDYIRYPDNHHCFCDGCRARFEAKVGRPVANWPKDVRADKELARLWTEFRCSNVTALVRGVSERVRREFPDVQLSAAVFHNVLNCPAGVGQAWASWCREGLVDFVCPMDYYMGSSAAFKSLVRSQVEACAGGKVKIRPGLGLSCWKKFDRDAFTMAEQIGIVRDFGLDGFTVFNYDERALRVLPALHTGPTKTDGTPAPESEDVISLEGTYPGHLQDVWTDADTIWWAHTRHLVKTDRNGHILTQADVGGHHAGCEVRDGRLYSAVCAFNGEPRGATTPECHVMVGEYDAETLQRIEMHVLDINDRAGSFCFLEDGTFLVGCLRHPSLKPTEVKFHHVSRDYKLIKTHVVDLGKPVQLGIEVIRRYGNDVYLFIYGGPVMKLDATTFEVTGKYRSFGGQMGFARDGEFAWTGFSKKDPQTNRWSSGLKRHRIAWRP